MRYIYRKKDERARRNIEEEVRERDTDTVTVTEIRRVREIYREKYILSARRRCRKISQRETNERDF